MRNFFGVLILAMAAYIVMPVLPQSITLPVNKLLGFNDTHHLPFIRVKTVADLDAAIKAANDPCNARFLCRLVYFMQRNGKTYL